MGRIEPQSRPGRPNSRRGGAALFAAGLMLGAGLGPFASVFAADASVDARPTILDSGAPRTVDLGPRKEPIIIASEAVPNEPSDKSLFQEWLALAEAERLEAMARKVTGAGLDLVAESVIGRLEEDSLKSLIVSTTDFSSEDLSEIEDLPRFASDLARIAMEGTVRDAPEPDDGVRPIDFAQEITWDHRAAYSQSQFSSGVPRIYAVFESDALGMSQALAKWTRVADGEIMLFKRHRIRPAANSSYIYLDAPQEGWRPGEYRVDFYSADPELRWIASGEHRISL